MRFIIKQYFFCKDTGCKTIKDYMLTYRKTDYILSVDVIKKFTDMCFEYYEIDPRYTYSTPGLTWRSGFKYTNIRSNYYKEEADNLYDTMQRAIRG